MIDGRRIAALVPMRHHSDRVPGKNYRLFHGRPLYHRIIETLQACPEIADVLIDTDSPVIMEDAAKHFPKVKVIERPSHLRGGEVPMNDVLSHDVTQLAADWYLQTHSTNPLLRIRTVSAAIEKFLREYPRFDSLFSATRIQTRFWDASGRPVNHDRNALVRTQDLPPLFEENSNIYIFSREGLEANGSRIGKKPLIFEIGKLEAIDIDEEADFLMAEALDETSRRSG